MFLDVKNAELRYLFTFKVPLKPPLNNAAFFLAVYFRRKLIKTEIKAIEIKLHLMKIFKV